MDVMLAYKVDLEGVALPCFVQPKLDGVRAFWNSYGKQFWTRNGLVIDEVPYLGRELIASRLGRYNLDGELYAHGLSFDEINYYVQNLSRDCPLQYHVFDIVNYRSFTFRNRKLQEFFDTKAGNNPWIKKVPTILVRTREELRAFYEKCLEQGYEGIMVRPRKGGYDFGRSRKLLKVKPVDDAEAKLVGFNKGTGKNTDRFGSLLLETNDGIRFHCDGLTERMRDRFMAEGICGQAVTFLHQGYTANGVPRFPRIKGERVDMVLPN